MLFRLPRFRSEIKNVLKLILPPCISDSMNLSNDSMDEPSVLRIVDNYPSICPNCNFDLSSQSHQDTNTSPKSTNISKYNFGRRRRNTSYKNSSVKFYGISSGVQSNGVSSAISNPSSYDHAPYKM